MLGLLTRNWWALALRGVIAILFGLAALAWPALTLLALVVLFGLYVLADGILAVITGFAERGKGWGWLLLEGLLLLAIGVAVFRWPGVTAVTLLFLIAARAVVVGVLEIATAVELRRELQGEWLLAFNGVVSILFGVLIVAVPTAGALAVVWLIGLYAIVFGVLMIALAFRLKSWGPRIVGPAPA
jgi:uncharacterized membrane protein HdeD (DUF308 family)